MPFGTIVKVALKDEVAVYPLCHENEVVEISDGIAKLQGVAKAEFVLLKDGKETKISVDFGVGGTCNIEI